MRKAEEKREQSILDNRMAEMIDTWLDKQFQQAYPTNGAEEADVQHAEITIRAAYKLIARNREKIERIKARMAWAKENGIAA